MNDAMEDFLSLAPGQVVGYVLRSQVEHTDEEWKAKFDQDFGPEKKPRVPTYRSNYFYMLELNRVRVHGPSKQKTVNIRRFEYPETTILKLVDTYLGGVSPVRVEIEDVHGMTTVYTSDGEYYPPFEQVATIHLE